MDKYKLKLYQSGWTFPEKQINWTAYVFYGADIREYHLDFMKKQLSEMANIQDITGYFLIDDHDGDFICAGRYMRVRLLNSRISYSTNK